MQRANCDGDICCVRSARASASIAATMSQRTAKQRSEKKTIVSIPRNLSYTTQLFLDSFTAIDAIDSPTSARALECHLLFGRALFISLKREQHCGASPADAREFRFEVLYPGRIHFLRAHDDVSFHVPLKAWYATKKLGRQILECHRSILERIVVLLIQALEVPRIKLPNGFLPAASRVAFTVCCGAL